MLTVFLGRSGGGINWETATGTYTSGGSAARSLPNSAGGRRDANSAPGLGRSPGVGKANPLQYSCPGSPMEREAWQATAHRITKSEMRWSAHA